MGQRSKIRQLPTEIRAWLDRSLSEKDFSGYRELEAELALRGIAISRSSIHRYGVNLERKLGAIKASTEAAKLIAAEAPDDADQRSGAVISLIQTEVFDVLVALQDLDDDADPLKRAKLLSTLAKNVATLSRASVHQKRHEIEIRAKTEAAADRVARLAKKGGLSASTVDSIKREILGIAA
jgi:hypothetical protein